MDPPRQLGIACCHDPPPAGVENVEVTQEAEHSDRPVRLRLWQHVPEASARPHDDIVEHRRGINPRILGFPVRRVSSIAMSASRIPEPLALSKSYIVLW